MVDLIEYLENIDNRLAAIVILLIMILQSPILTFPGYLLMIYAGFRFGLITGALINFFGLYASCIIGYRFGLWSSNDLGKRSNPRMQKFQNWAQEKGIKIVLFLRILPLIPNNITSIGSGYAKLSERQHALYSGFSILQSFFWSFIGSHLLMAIIGELHLEITIYHGLILVLLISALIFLKYSSNSKNGNPKFV